MRKQYKIKKRSCPLCKPNKMGYTNRWKLKDYDKLKRDEKEIKDHERL